MTPLRDCLEQLTQDLIGFIELLEQETRFLAAGDSERLEPLIAQRDATSSQLAAHWRDLAGLLEMPASTGLGALREQTRPSAIAASAWRRLETLAMEAEHLNRVNGRLLEEQMRRTQAAMQVLRNAVASRNLYGSDGRMSDFLNTNRSIDKA